MTAIENEKPSERLQFALDALIEAEKPRAKVKPKMSVFHERDRTDNTCFACLAGLAAIKAFDLNPEEIIPCTLGTATVNGKTSNVIDDYEVGLNLARMGVISGYFRHMRYAPEAGEPFNRVLPDYHKHPKEFKESLATLITDLKNGGY